MKTKAIVLLLFAWFMGIPILAQEKEDRNSKQEQTSQTSLLEVIQSRSDQYIITQEHVSKISNVRNVYLRQAIQGVGIVGTESSIHISPTGEIISEHNRFVKDASGKVKSATQSLSAAQAIQRVASTMGYGLPDLTQLQAPKGVQKATLFNDGGISLEKIPVELVYFMDTEGDITLCWQLSIAEVNSADWFNFLVDASNGRILKQVNWTVNCGHVHEHEEAAAPYDYHANLYDIPDYAEEVEENSAACNTCYEVFAMPIESPYFGSRTIETNPADPTASPFGWHDTDGVAGAEFTVTEGNNVRAFENGDNVGYQPDGGADLDFTGYAFSQDYSSTDQYEDAAITNLFYWNNIIHDVMYQYGFDEAAGNFQVNNYGNGGLGNDSVKAQAQDGAGTCNANFATPVDGNQPRMRMYICGDKDGDFEGLVIAHEYAHGISTRLTGGAANSDCLRNDEQMGEGWSDFYGYMLTMEDGETGTDARGVGMYLFDQGPGGGGIRTFLYSTDMAVNPHTYDDIKTTGTSPHRLGEKWGVMLWDLAWNLIDAHGFSNDFYTVTGDVSLDAGNVQALAIVTEAMKMQPCSPGFVDGRDAILAADAAIYGGANECIIWSTFARRGLGLSADQGSTDDRTDGTEAFDTPNPPTALCKSDLEFMVDINGEVHLEASDIDNGSYDSCGIEEMNVSPNSFTCDDIGTQEVTLTVIDTDGNEDSCTTTIEILKRPMSLEYTGDLDEQYSDQTDLSALLTDGPDGDPLSGRTVTFTIGSQSVEATTDSDGIAEATLILTQDPNQVYTVETSVEAEDCYTEGTDSDAYDIVQEDALVEYTGHTFQATPSANDSETVVVLTANIQDITPSDPGSDPYEGDIRNAMVKFVDRDANSDISPWIPVTDLFDPSDPTTGTVSFDWLVDLGNNKDSESVMVGIVVGSLDDNGYYLHSDANDNTVVTVYKPDGDFVTGGGTIHPDNSAGQYASTNGLKVNFGYNVKYNKGGKKLIGHANIIFRIDQGGQIHTYQIKGNAVQSLGVNVADENNKLAEFASKANLQEVTDPENPVSLGGNLRLHVDMTDKGNPGFDDMISFNLTTVDGILLYSSNWSGLETEEMLLSGGNVVIHSGFSNAPLLFITDEANSFGEMSLYPNPTSQLLYMRHTDLQSITGVGIYDLSGRLVKQIDVNTSQGELIMDVSALAASTYIFVIESENGKIIKRIIKQ